MSAYVVDPKTINRILTFLHYAKIGNDCYERSWADFAQEKLQAIEFDIDTQDELADLGQAMYNTNINAVGQRYPDCKTLDDLPGTITEKNGVTVLVPFKFQQTRFVKAVQALKSLRCWLYQCSEGNVPETDLYKIWEELSGSLAFCIVNKMPEYDAADWS